MTGEKYIGKKYNKWTVLRRDKRINGRRFYLCQCECGTTKLVGIGTVVSGGSKGCALCREQGNLEKDMVGKSFGRWTVLRKIPSKGFECRCECGTIFTLAKKALTEGQTTGCRKCQYERIRKAQNEIVGKVFGKTTVIKVEKGGLFTCKCTCGKIMKQVGRSQLEKGERQSCFLCFAKTHGKSKTLLYATWKGMKARCNNKRTESYPLYGGRGIKVCKRWSKFENFYEDMGDKPEACMQIDRIDNDGNYCKENCRWVTSKENCNNRRNSLHSRKKSPDDQTSFL